MEAKTMFSGKKPTELREKDRDSGIRILGEEASSPGRKSTAKERKRKHPKPTNHTNTLGKQRAQTRGSNSDMESVTRTRGKHFQDFHFA